MLSWQSHLTTDCHTALMLLPTASCQCTFLNINMSISCNLLGRTDGTGNAKVGLGGETCLLLHVPSTGWQACKIMLVSFLTDLVLATTVTSTKQARLSQALCQLCNAQAAGLVALMLCFACRQVALP